MTASARRAVLSVASWFTRCNSGLMLFYHDIHDRTKYTDMGTSLPLFREHVDAIKSRGCSFVPWIPTRVGEIKLCFDDGFRGIWDCRDFFKAKGICPTVFIAPGLVGKSGYLTWDEIKELCNYGFCFQSHTWSHRPLPEVGEHELRHELFDSRLEIEERLGTAATGLCFPRGLFSRRIIDAAITAGYTELYSSIPGELNYLSRIMPKETNAKLYTRHLVQFFSANEVGCVIRGAMKPFAKHYLSLHYSS